MSTGWVGAGVRARALARRRLGSRGVRELAASPGLPQALEVLVGSPYGRDVHRGQTLAQAQHAVSATLLWHVRVLAGWLPRGDASVMRVLAGGFELANVEQRLREQRGQDCEPPYHLGGLATIATTLTHAADPAELRTLLARTVWGDPGSQTPDGIRLGMRLAWAARVSGNVPLARPWAVGAGTLLVARARLLDGATLTDQQAQIAFRLLGTRWAAAATMTEFRNCLPSNARWPLDGIEEADDLWRSELRWWARLAGDGLRLLRRPVTEPDPVIGVVAVLAADAWRVRAALEVAARGGAANRVAVEAFDAAA